MGYGVPVSSPIKKVRKPKTGNGMSEYQHLGAWKTNGTLLETTTESYMRQREKKWNPTLKTNGTVLGVLKNMS